MNLIPDQPLNCPSCGKKFEGPFCYACGEKRISPKDYTLRKYAVQAIDIFTHFDGKFYRSIKYLLFFPGKLTNETLAGRRVMLMKPVQLFVVISLLYFILMKQHDFFYSFLDDMKHSEVYQIAKREAAARNITVEVYAEQYDRATVTTGKTLIFSMIPFFALGVWLFHLKRLNLFVPHLIFATHFFAFFLAFLLLYFELVLRWLNPATLSNMQKLIGLSAGMLVVAAYLFFALRHVYRQSAFLSLFKTFGLIVWLIVILSCYRLGISWLTLLIA